MSILKFCKTDDFVENDKKLKATNFENIKVLEKFTNYLPTNNFNNFFEWFESERISKTKLNTQDCIISAKNLIKNINSKTDSWLKIKIQNYMIRNGFDLDIQTILQKIESDELFAALFSKPFMKQGVEDTQLFYLKDKYFIQSNRGKSDKFPITANGENSYRFTNDGQFKKGIKKTNKTSKSIDSLIFIGDTRFWTTQKVTTDDGGATNSVNDDIIKFLKPNMIFLNRNTNNTDKFVYLLDGPYWKRKNRKTDKYNRLELLQKEFQNENIIICDSDEFGKKYGNK